MGKLGSITEKLLKASPADSDMLSERQREILRQIIHHYVLTANPVGSRYLSRVSSLGLSDASTRNVMADLEYLGYIDHPHTSAGRTPTDKGYRMYVDDLMALEHITDSERKAVSRSLVDAITPEDVLRETTNILAKLSKQLSLVLLPSLDEGILERVEIVPLSSNRLLIVLAASSGRVRTVTLEMEADISQSKLDDLRQVLNTRLAGRSFREVKTTFRDRVQDLSEQEKSILRVFLDAPERLFDDTGAERVKLSGAKNIFAQPEFQNKSSFSDDQFQSIIELLEDEQVVIHVLERSGGELTLADSAINGTSKVAIRIGSELENEKMQNYSVICTKYQIGDQRGMIGVIGPKRMNYSRMAPLVEYVARAMTNALSPK
ncbi:MAG: heat-inducible transcriptional repressor HrcA [Candidatus Kapaibacterium sp.]|jgi:heat-inducible transcriptional repressor